jgi:steroid 5-alpha reductase family enzyme
VKATTRLSFFFLLALVHFVSNTNGFAVSPPMTTLRKSPNGLSTYKANTTKRNYSLIPLLDPSNPLWKASGVYVVSNVIGFVISLATGSHVHLDLIGTGAFALAAWPGISSTVPHIQWSSYAVVIWSTKLASFLFYRATLVGDDMRLEEMLKSFSGIFGFWFLTLMWNVCCSFPYLLGLSSTRSGSPVFAKVGGLIYLAGLCIETLADAQKWFFKQANPGQFCNVGLWSISQHPNFFGNLLLWAGIFVMNMPALIDPMPVPANGSVWTKVWSYRRLLLALISPIFMWGLLNGQAQGTVTNSMQLAASKYGDNPEYEKYLNEVPAIIPKLW